MKKLFNSLKMRWLTVILFAVIAGIYTGAVMLIPALEHTSFQDIGISYEWWVIFAVIIVVNCKKNWEAMLKCFAFFFISQPLVFLTEIVFGNLSIDQGIYYWRLWLPAMLLTIPGGFIAFYCKKQNLLGSIILGLGNTIELVMGGYYLVTCARDFPRHLLTTLVCFSSIVIMSLCIQEKRTYRILSILFPVCACAILAVVLPLTGRSLF